MHGHLAAFRRAAAVHSGTTDAPDAPRRADAPAPGLTSVTRKRILCRAAGRNARKTETNPMAVRFDPKRQATSVEAPLSWEVLTHYLSRLASKFPESEDLVQETLLRLVEVGLHPGLDATKLGAHILRGLGIDSLRRPRPAPAGDLFGQICDVRSERDAIDGRLRAVLEGDVWVKKTLGQRGIDLLVAIGNGIRTTKALARFFQVHAKSIRQRRRRLLGILCALRSLRPAAAAEPESPPASGTSTP
jgi:hypothetical protein